MIYFFLCHISFIFTNNRLRYDAPAELSAAGLFKYVWLFSGQALEGLVV